jgi:hypothetical protein
MSKYAYEFGKRWHADTPRYAIKRKAAQVHVTDHKKLLDMIDQAIENSPDKAQFTKTIRSECYRYAALCMKQNMDLYRKVMS